MTTVAERVGGTSGTRGSRKRRFSTLRVVRPRPAPEPAPPSRGLLAALRRWLAPLV